jgi:hypothetical protein
MGLSTTTYVVSDDTQDVVAEVNAALSGDLKFVNFTKQDDGKQVAVPAVDVYDIEEV